MKDKSNPPIKRTLKEQIEHIIDNKLQHKFIKCDSEISYCKKNTINFKRRLKKIEEKLFL